MKINVKDIIRSVSIFFVIVIFSTYGNAQMSFKIDRDIFLPDLSVKISERKIIRGQVSTFDIKDKIESKKRSF